MNYTPPLAPAFIKEIQIPPHRSGPLTGLSFGAKDNMDMAGEITGYGSPSWATTHGKAPAHAICIEQLLNAGAQCLGKTQTDELAYSLLGVNAFHGTPVNPRAPEHIPGGSSSGSASAVAAGGVDFALGTDTGGSVRVPASNCGIWGLRPTHGRISPAGVLDLAPSYDTVGILSPSGAILEQVAAVLLAEEPRPHKNEFKLCMVEDFFQLAEAGIQKRLEPIVDHLATCCQTTSRGLARIFQPHVDWQWLFQQLGILLSLEIWNSLGSWVEGTSPELSPGTAHGLETYAKGTKRNTIQEHFQLRQEFK
ncbi:MAG: hypothetical protein MI747_18895, partial [Desulfobacterales bacterium]|nr:hypothetical protein [Desulfobacterales bacterium]